MSENVPSPWTSVEMDLGKSRVSVKVWGREYVWEDSLLPVSIKTAGREILASPAALCARFDGEEKPFGEIVYLPVSAEEDKAVFTVCASAGNILVNIRWSVEYDGYAEMAMSVIPFWSFFGVSPVCLDGLELRFPLTEESSRLFHYWPADQYDGLASGAVPAEGVEHTFKPYFWTGWEFGGLGISTETDEFMNVAPGTSYFSLKEEEGGRLLCIRLLDRKPKAWKSREDNWGDALEPVDYVFGLQATPVKQLRADRMEYRILHTDWPSDDRLLTPDSEGQTELDRYCKLGVNRLIFHENWSAMQNYGQAADEERFKICVEECHRRGIRVMAYFGYEYPTNAPLWHEKKDDYLIKNPAGHFIGGWQRNNPCQRAYMVCYAGGYAEGMRERVRFAMEHYDLDGIYTDGTYIPWGCANSAHGCGYTDEEGIRHPTYPISAVRRHVRALYELVHGMGGMIDTHQSSCLLAPTLAFADSFYNGESIQEKLKESFLGFLNLPAFRTEYMGKNLGAFPQMLASVDERMPIEKALSLSLIHDILPRPNTIQTAAVISPYWKVLSEFGSGDAVWHPYWEEGGPVDSLTKNAYCSVYEKDGRLLAAVSSFNEETDTVVLRFRFPIRYFGIAPGYAEVTEVSSDGLTVTLRIAAFRPELIHFDRLGGGAAAKKRH